MSAILPCAYQVAGSRSRRPSTPARPRCPWRAAGGEGFPAVCWALAVPRVRRAPAQVGGELPSGGPGRRQGAGQDSPELALRLLRRIKLVIFGTFLLNSPALRESWRR